MRQMYLHPIGKSDADRGSGDHSINAPAAKLLLRSHFGNINWDHRCQEAISNALKGLLVKTLYQSEDGSYDEDAARNYRMS